MKAILQSQSGVEIHLQQAVFHRPEPDADASPNRCAVLPAMRVDATLLASIREVGGIATASGALQVESAGFGVLYAYGDGSLATLVFDLSRSEVRHWLAGAQRTGDLPVLMQCGEAAKLVRVPFDADIARLAELASTCASPTADDIVFAMQFVVGQLDDTSTLSRCGLDFGPLKQASVSVLTPGTSASMPGTLH